MPDLKRHWHRIARHQGLKNTGYLTVGQAISQGISLVGAFYIPRLLGPEQYGIYQSALAYVALFTIFTMTGLSRVMTRECAQRIKESRKIIESLVGLANFFSLTATLLSIGLVFLIGYDHVLQIYIVIFSFSLLFKGLGVSINSIFESHEDFKNLALILCLQNSLLVIGSIIIIKIGYGVMTLILFRLVLELAMLLFKYRISRRHLIFNPWTGVKIIKKYIRPGINFSLLGFMNFLSGRVDLVMLSLLATPKQVGIYALAYRIVQKGLIMRRSIAQGFFPRYAKKFKEGGIKTRMLWRHTLFILIPSLLVIILTLLGSEYVIVNIVGTAYSDSVAIINLLVVFLILRYLCLPWALYLQTGGHERLLVYAGALAGLLNISLNLIFFKLYGVVGIAYSTLVVEGLRLLGVLFLVKARTISEQI